MANLPRDYGTVKYYRRKAACSRSIFDDGWRTQLIDIATYMAPGMLKCLQQGKQIGTNGVGIMDKIYNTTHFEAIDTSAAGFHNGLTPPSKPWFVIQPTDEKLLDADGSREFCHDTRQVILNGMAKSNMYDTFHNFYIDLLTFCTAGFIIEEHDEKIFNGVRLIPGTYYVGMGSDGYYNLLVREFSKTSLQMVEEYGYEKCSRTVQSAYDQADVKTLFTVIQVIEPNLNFVYGRADAQGMRWRNVHFENSADKFLLASGYRVCPFIIQPWSLEGADIYGRGPGWKALPIIKQLQRMELDEMKGTSKMADPPMVGPFNQLQIRNFPGAYTPLQQGVQASQIAPLYAGGINLPQLENSMDRKQREVKAIFFADKFLMLAQDELSKNGVITATQASIMNGERLAVLAPQVEKVQSKSINPALDRMYDICESRGLLPMPPEELQGQPLKIELVGTLAMAQKADELAKNNSFILLAGQIAQLDPSALKRLNGDEMLQGAADSLAINPNALKSDKEMAELAQAEQAAREAEQSQSQAVMLAQMAQGAAKTAKDLGTTPMGDSTVLDQMANQAGNESIGGIGL